MNFLTSDSKLLENKDYLTISSVLSRMVRFGATAMGYGFCPGMSDMVQSALAHRGIKSRLVECQLTITYFNADPPEMTFIGFSNMINPGEIDTHIVVLTETDPPFLIDASVQGKLPPDTPVVIEPLLDDLDRKFILVDSFFKDQNVKCTYEQKKVQSFPISHNESIIERIKTDKKVFNSLESLKILLAVALTISTLNAFRGFYDYYQVYISDDNNWGPQAAKKINDRMIRLEKMLQIPLEERKEKFKEAGQE